MKASFWTTLFIATVVCIAMVGTQAAKNRELARRLADAQGTPGTAGGGAPVLGGERMGRALAVLEGLDAGASAQAERNEDPFRVADFPDFLGAVRDLSVEELIELAERLPASENRTRLLLVAAGRDPLRVYRDAALMAGLPKGEVLEALAEADPAAALRELPPPQPEADHAGGIVEGVVAGVFKLQSGAGAAPLLANPELAARIRYSTMLLGVDLERGLAALLEVREADPAGDGRIPLGVVGSLGAPSLPEGVIPGLIDAVGRREYAGIREDIIGMIVMDTQFKHGVAAVGGQLDSLQLTRLELDRAIEAMRRRGALEAEPVAMLDWLAEVRPGQVPSAVVEWANRDQRGAADWLVARDPSPLRDRALAEFARRASELDREAAALWAKEIGDEALRNETLEVIGAD